MEKEREDIEEYAIDLAEKLFDELFKFLGDPDGFYCDELYIRERELNMTVERGEFEFDMYTFVENAEKLLKFIEETKEE
ncbi:MAG: hypothetical protein ACTSR0_04015 [Candidatus Asgardarchaeia archaeon]